MLGIFNQLEPPVYLNDRQKGTAPDTVQFYRSVGRELDLSPWFAGPVLIVIGQLEGAAIPIPMKVDGETPEVTDDSLTVVRWIHPLPVEEKIAFPEVFDENNGP